MFGCSVFFPLLLLLFWMGCFCCWVPAGLLEWLAVCSSPFTLLPLPAPLLLLTCCLPAMPALCPSPPPLQAIKIFEDLAWSDELRLDWNLRPGDVQLLSNHTCLHSRAGFVDDPRDPAAQRHLLRLWLAPPGDRPLPEAYREIMGGGSLEPGVRGGIATQQATKLRVPLEAEE